MANKYQKARGRELILRQLQQAIGMWAQQKEYDSRREERSDYQEQRGLEREEDKVESKRRYDQDYDLRANKLAADQQAKSRRIPGITPGNTPQARNLQLRAQELNISMKDFRDSYWAEIQDLTAQATRFKYEADVAWDQSDESKAAAVKYEEIKRIVFQKQKEWELLNKMAASEDNVRMLRDQTGDAQFNSEQGPRSNVLDNTSFSENSAAAMSLSPAADPSADITGEMLQSYQLLRSRWGIPRWHEAEQLLQGVGMPQQPPQQAQPDAGQLGLEIPIGSSYPGIKPKMPPGVDPRSG